MLQDNIKVVMDEIQEAMAMTRAGRWDSVYIPSRVTGSYKELVTCTLTSI